MNSFHYFELFIKPKTAKTCVRSLAHRIYIKMTFFLLYFTHWTCFHCLGQSAKLLLLWHILAMSSSYTWSERMIGTTKVLFVKMVFVKSLLIVCFSTMRSRWFFFAFAVTTTTKYSMTIFCVLLPIHHTKATSHALFFPAYAHHLAISFWQMFLVPLETAHKMDKNYFATNYIEPLTS